MKEAHSQTVGINFYTLFPEDDEMVIEHPRIHCHRSNNPEEPDMLSDTVRQLHRATALR